VKGRYGVDAPGALTGITVGAASELVAAVLAFYLGWTIVGVVLLLGGCYFALSAASYAYTTLYGKVVVWRRELERLALTGDEHVLDLGCGRGLVLVLVARLVPRGSATGIDLWRGKDQSGNTPEMAAANAAAEGVHGRVDIGTGDMRELPFEDGRFDVVLSSLALHNIPDAVGRAVAIREAYRVLKPGGLVSLADFQHVREYESVLRELGARDVRVRGLGARFWYGGPWFGTRMVSARKVNGWTEKGPATDFRGRP
jgi:ubiquinone/menaquinone biosynthesis C-methylase UbiE